ncbi:DUF2236 domain-containing protein [Oleomonas cavernae]|uniref:DUF2236 domain-containing protein n=1 Tax=Oleomonas cavernae TaxID=2320859 RepID=A0A418WES7_9PROT|nr:oxygenase MpaB family protein [Oleomonas cavernae]RJF88528.1 DUF2236 domain-containing protein [Oleomonas cavernae]
MTSLEELKAKVAAQKTRIPSLYGKVDFSITPERFADQPGDESSLRGAAAIAYRQKFLAEHETVERARAYTMLGDTVADAYAALMPQYGFKRLIGMLTQACDLGVETVADAPAELVAFIHAMETVPQWLNMDLVREGARASRNGAANLSPFVARGAFVATFMNKYSALPMALTGTLSHESAVRRIKETATFFSTTALPGALDRHGSGFKAAAMVRLMHSMVRFNILRASSKWDVSVYGIPVPQVDQMPAGTISVFLLAFKMMRQGRTNFTAEERAVVEFNRYRCYLLGLPEELLPDTPQGIYNAMMVYSGTLRAGYDNETCGALVRATMAAYFPADRSLKSRIFNRLEKSFAKVFFHRAFLSGDDGSKAQQMGVVLRPVDKLVFVALSLFVFSRLGLYALAMQLPGLAAVTDRILIAKLNRQLAGYGHAEYTTDSSKYKEARAA